MRLATARAAPPADRFEEAEATFSALVNRLQSEETARMSHVSFRQKGVGSRRPQIS